MNELKITVETTKIYCFAGQKFATLLEAQVAGVHEQVFVAARDCDLPELDSMVIADFAEEHFGVLTNALIPPKIGKK